jgi:hypothetical protein
MEDKVVTWAELSNKPHEVAPGYLAYFILGVGVEDGRGGISNNRVGGWSVQGGAPSVDILLMIVLIMVLEHFQDFLWEA